MVMVATTYLLGLLLAESMLAGLNLEVLLQLLISEVEGSLEKVGIMLDG